MGKVGGMETSHGPQAQLEVRSGFVSEQHLPSPQSWETLASCTQTCEESLLMPMTDVASKQDNMMTTNILTIINIFQAGWFANQMIRVLFQLASGK